MKRTSCIIQMNQVRKMCSILTTVVIDIPPRFTKSFKELNNSNPSREWDVSALILFFFFFSSSFFFVFFFLYQQKGRMKCKTKATNKAENRSKIEYKLHKFICTKTYNIWGKGMSLQPILPNPSQPLGEMEICQFVLSCLSFSLCPSVDLFVSVVSMSVRHYLYICVCVCLLEFLPKTVIIWEGWVAEHYHKHNNNKAKQKWLHAKANSHIYMRSLVAKQVNPSGR